MKNPDGSIIEERRYSRGLMDVREQAAAIVAARFHGERPSSDEELTTALFTGGDPVKIAVRALFDRLEGKLDTQKVARLREAFERGVDIWERAGLFTLEREQAGYAKPDFGRDYLPLLTQTDMDRAEPGVALNRGYSTPVFAPMDVPLHSDNAEKLSYLKLLKEALLEAFRGTAGGKQPNTLLIGPEKRVLTAEQVYSDAILQVWERYLESGIVHNIQNLDLRNHGGVSEGEVLTQLTGNEQRTGGVMRLERDRLIMPSDVEKKAMSALGWEKLLPSMLPPGADAQDFRQAIAHIIYCLETQGWIPDFFDYEKPRKSSVNLALKSFFSDEGGKQGAVPALYWNGDTGQFNVGRSNADYRDSDRGVRAGVRKKGA